MRYEVAHQVAVALSHQGYLLAQPGFRTNARGEVVYADRVVVRVPAYPRFDRPLVFNRPGDIPLSMSMIESASGPYSIHASGGVGPRGAPSALVQLLRSMDPVHGRVIQDLPSLVLLIEWGTLHTENVSGILAYGASGVSLQHPGPMYSGPAAGSAQDEMLSALVAGFTRDKLAYWQQADLLARTAGNRYFVVIRAYDFQSWYREHRQVLLGPQR